MVVFKIVVEGKEAHGAYPHLGVNALVRGVDVYREMFELPFARRTTEWYPRGCALNLVRVDSLGAGRDNVVPGSSSLRVAIRFLPGQTVSGIGFEVGKIAGVREVDPVWQLPPMTVDADDPFLLAIFKTLGPSGRLGVRSGASDLPGFGIRGVEWGPRGDGHHSGGERVDLESLEPFARRVEAVAIDAFAISGETGSTPTN